MIVDLDGTSYDYSVRSIIDAITDYTPKSTPTPSDVCHCSPSDACRLLKDMRALDPAFVVRRVLEHLQIDESSPFQFRVDHKLIQGILLERFVPTSALRVIGLADATTKAGRGSVNSFLEMKFPLGFVVKNVYGYASGRNVVLNSHKSLEAHTEVALGEYRGQADTELYFVQERFTTVREYRVHSIREAVIPTLTFCTYGSQNAMGELERSTVNAFVASTIKAMPQALVEDSLCGWDIGVCESGEYKVFEINYSGLHPVFEPGFHCSGYWQGETDGTLNIARLLHFVTHSSGVNFSISLSPAFNPLEADAASVLYQVERWLWLLTMADKVYEMWRGSYQETHSVNDTNGRIESIRSLIYANAAGPTERRYCEYLDWLKKMTDDLR